jgi:hypothetical protein
LLHGRMIVVSVFGAACKNNWSPLGVIILRQLWESIFTYNNWIGKQELLDRWVFFDCPSYNGTRGWHLLGRASSNTKRLSSCKFTRAIYISWGQ